MQPRTLNTIAIILALPSLALTAGCGEDGTPGTGTYTVTVYGEDFVEDKIPASETDGWEIDFTTLAVTLSDIHATNDDGERVDFDGTYTIDLTESWGGEGHLIAEAAAPAGRYNSLTYRIAPDADHSAIVVAGTAKKEDQTLSFEWNFETDTVYENCQTEAFVDTDGSASSELTIHADHFFYDSLVGDEPIVAFDLVASADANDDGQLTLDELAQVDITTQSRYQVGSRDITDLRTYVEAQTATLGHIDGEGHCD